MTSPNFSSHDKDLLEKSTIEKEKIIAESFLTELQDDPENIKYHFSKLMAYMLVHQVHGKPQLEIKIALTENGNGIFHEKLGIVHYANEDIISFVGSINETGSGWD